ncbi:MAG TPA: hypothetical protein V6D08_18890 [Candidatus Obscuribacterales bacterium]
MAERFENGQANKPEEKADNASLEALRLQIEAHKKQDGSRSLLGQAVDTVWRSDDRSLKELERLLAEGEQKAKAGDTAGLASMEKDIRERIKADQQAVATQDQVSGYGAGFLKTAALFMRGRLGLAGTIALYGLDQLRPADDWKTQLADFSLGGLKGAGMRGVFHVLGQKNVGIAAKGVGLGVSSRVLDLGLSRQTYLSADGSYSLGSGLGNVVRGSLDKSALVSDVVIFGAAHGLLKGANNLTGDAIKRSPFASTVLTGTTFGLSSGAWSELERQRRAGEEFDLGKIVKSSLIQGALDTAAATAGGIQASRAARMRSQLSADEAGASRTAQSARLANLGPALEVRSPGQAEALLAAGKPADSAKLPTHQPEQGWVSVSKSPSETSGRPAAPGERAQSLVPESNPGGSHETGKVVKSPESSASPKDSKGTRATQQQTVLEDGTRIISKPDGSSVTIRPNGDVTIEKDGVKTTHRKSDGMVIVEKPGGEKHEYRPKSAIKPEEKPLNVASMSVEPIAKLLSNFAETPFVLDGVRYASVEGFYQSLRITDPVRRAQVSQLHGKEAKAAGNGFKTATHGEYRGEVFELGSPRHHEIVKRAIRAKLEQNPELARQFIETHPRPIIHNTGRPESKSTKYPGAVFSQTLMELRQELVDKQNATRPPEAIPVKDTAEKPAVTESSALRPKSVSRLLRSIAAPDHQATDYHPIKFYERAFKDFDRLATRVLGFGADVVAIELVDGNVLKISQRALTPEMGNRPFDLPILERGQRIVEGDTINYFIQPKVKPVTLTELLEFHREVRKHGYYLSDSSVDQIGRYEPTGKVVLIDPWAAEKLPNQ